MRPRAAKEEKLFLLAAALLAAAAALLAPASTEASRYLPQALEPVTAPPASLEDLAGAADHPALPALSASDRLDLVDLAAGARLEEQRLGLHLASGELEAAWKTASGGQTWVAEDNVRPFSEMGVKTRRVTFQGLWTDPVTGLAYARARWYDARNASWLSEDPLLDVDSPNLYAFVGWGPHVGTDPLGLHEISDEEIEAWKAAHPGYAFSELTDWIDQQHDAANAAEAAKIQPNWLERQWDRGVGAARWLNETKDALWEGTAGRARDAYSRVTSGWARAHKADVDDGTFVDPKLEAMTVEHGGKLLAQGLNEAVETGAVVNDTGARVVEQGAKVYVEGKALEYAVGAGTGILSAAPPGASAAARLQANRVAGNSFRDEIAEQLTSAGFEVQKEVYKRTPFGKRFIDIEVSQGGKVLGGIETKVGSSRYTASQRAKDMWLWLAHRYRVNVVRE